MKKLPFLLLLCCLAALAAKETLNLRLDSEQDIPIGSAPLQLTGTFTADGYWSFGPQGLAIPAETLVGNQGTVLFKFKIAEFVEPLLLPRYLLTLRTNGRLTLGLYTFGNNSHLHFSFTDQDKKFYYRHPDKIVFDRPYQMGYTWDGNLVRVYLNGRMVAETPQPLPVSNLRTIHIGPYRDSWYAPKPWGPDCFATQLRTWNHPLSPAEMAEACGAEVRPLETDFPSRLAIPKTAAAPALDGDLNDPCWPAAASFVGLTHGKEPMKSWELPENQTLFTWDNDHLYVGFRTLFPGRVPLKTGDPRTPEREPEVWGDESFELYIFFGDQYYRFAGNVAGGSTEAHGTDNNWNGPWTYKTTCKMRIDDRQHWQGEIAIPWQTLARTAPPTEPFRLNFCRSWRLPETGTHSSLIPGGNYNRTEDFPEVHLSQSPAGFAFLTTDNPALGHLRQTLRLQGNANDAFHCQILLGRADGLAMPKPLLDKVCQTTGTTPVSETIDLPLNQTGFDRLVFRISRNNTLLLQQIMPYHLNEDFLLAAPRFLQEKIGIRIRHAMLQGKFGPAFTGTVRLRNPKGDTLAQLVFSDEAEQFIPFPRRNPPGDYTAELTDAATGTLLHALTLSYPGLGDWESMTYDNRIIPPFTPLQTTLSGSTLHTSMWGRSYLWNDSLLPSQITSQQVELLSRPITLLLNGKPLALPAPVAGQQAPHRTEFGADSNSGGIALAWRGWIEYDGVQWNEVTLTPEQPQDSLTLEITLPAALLRYLHTSDSYSWGTKITQAVQNGEQHFRFYPVVWIGNEDKGLCFFAESRHGWTSPGNATYTLRRNGEHGVLSVHLARKMPAATPFQFSFGLLASPVRPFPPDYPLNTFSYHFAAPLNRPGARPASKFMITQGGGELGAYFGDLPTPDLTRPAFKAHFDSARNIQANGGLAIPYTCDRYLSDEYPEVAAFRDEWKISPDQTLDYQRDGRKFYLWDCCPTTSASLFFMKKTREMIQRFGADGIYFDFGIVPFCNNTEHGCHQRIPLLAQREFYRRIILTQLDLGIREPTIVLHNTDSVQLPAMTFATHLFNGEHIRQHSSTIMHNGKDILDTYDVTMFASELSSLPFGLTNSVYQSNDVLIPLFGGGKEKPDLYKFRITQAMLTGTLPHNTLPALNRCHFGIFDKVIRIYDAFAVPEATFLGYWQKPANLLQGRDIFISVYRHRDGQRALAVVSHIGKERETQNVAFRLNAEVLNIPAPARVLDCLNAPDPDYDWLRQRRQSEKVPAERAPLECGDFGSADLKMDQGQVSLTLKPHTFALIEFIP